MYNIYTVYKNVNGVYVVDGEKGRNTFPTATTADEAKQMYMKH